MKVESKKPLSDENLKQLGFNVKLSLIDPFLIEAHLNERCPNPDFTKSFCIREKNGCLYLNYTCANVRKKNVEKTKLCVSVFYKPETKDLLFEFNFYGFFSENGHGNNFHHRKIFREKKTIRSTEDFLIHLSEIEGFYEKILYQTMKSSNLVFHNIRHEKPLTK